MTEPEDRDPAPPSPEKEVWLPPRLREKLGDAGAGGDDEDFLQRNPRNMIPGILATLIVVAVLGGVYLMIHTSQMKDRAEEARLAAAARRQTIADSLAHAREDSLAAMRAQAFHDSVFAFMKTPAGRRAFARARADSVVQARAQLGASQPAAAAAGGATAGGAATTTPPAGASQPAEPAAPPSSYGIEVGHFLDESMANSKLAEFKTATRLDGRVLNENGTYNVVLGKFGTKAAANSRARGLMGKIEADEFTVVELPK